jgi:hypothetical protein
VWSNEKRSGGAYFVEEKSIRQIARELRCSRPTIRKAIASSEPGSYTLTLSRPAPVLGPFKERVKDLLGSDHYQLMTADAIIRFWTLTACLLCFLEEQRTTATEPGLTCGEIRRRIQEQHRRNLLCWLRAQFEAGLTVHEIGIQLAISSS